MSLNQKGRINVLKFEATSGVWGSFSTIVFKYSFTDDFWLNFYFQFFILKSYSLFTYSIVT